VDHKITFTNAVSCSDRLDLEVRRKTLSITLALVSTRNVQEVVALLKKELQKAQGQDYDKVSEDGLWSKMVS
jgi:vesicle coat complex subunit